MQVLNYCAMYFTAHKCMLVSCLKALSHGLVLLVAKMTQVILELWMYYLFFLQLYVFGSYLCLLSYNILLPVSKKQTWNCYQDLFYIYMTDLKCSNKCLSPFYTSN